MNAYPRLTPAKGPLWQALLFLSLLCALFYAAMNYYAGNALNHIGDLQNLSATGQQLGLAAFKRLLGLRVLFSLLFCVLLGVLGWRVTARLWPAAGIHAVAVLVMLWQDVPHDVLTDGWWAALGLMAVVALCTLGGSAWGRWGTQKRRKLR